MRAGRLVGMDLGTCDGRLDGLTGAVAGRLVGGGLRNGMGKGASLMQANQPPQPPKRSKGSLALAPTNGRASGPGFCALVARVLGCRRCSVMLTDEHGELVVVESVGLPPELDGAARVAVGSGVAGRVALSNVPLLVNRSTDRDGLPLPLGVYETDAFISYPMPLPDGTTGVVNATDRVDGRPFAAADLDLLGQLTAFYASTFDASTRREVLRLRNELRRLRARSVRAQEEERQRLARELHDDAGHALTAAILRLDMTAQRMIGSGEVTETLASVRSVLTDCADHLHDLAFYLRPRLLADLGLAPAMRSLGRRIHDASGIDAPVTIHGVVRRLNDETELSAFRIGQEATTNALKHARATRIAIDLHFLEEWVVLEIVDNGVGLAPTTRDATGAGRDHHGLQGMRERAEMVGGVLEVGTAEGGGTHIQARLPVRETE